MAITFEPTQVASLNLKPAQLEILRAHLTSLIPDGEEVTPQLDNTIAMADFDQKGNYVPKLGKISFNLAFENDVLVLQALDSNRSPPERYTMIDLGQDEVAKVHWFAYTEPIFYEDLFWVIALVRVVTGAPPTTQH